MDKLCVNVYMCERIATRMAAMFRGQYVLNVSNCEKLIRMQPHKFAA